VDHQGDHPVGGPVLTRVVIVDDDLFVRSTLAGLLSAAPGIEVVATYDSGIEASAHAAGDRAHVTLVDISMPALGGPETTARLRAECPSTRVLALTSLTDPSAAAAMIAAGALGFLPKDLSVPAMVHAIEAARRGVSVLAGAGAELLGQQAPPVERPKLSDTEVAILRLVRDGQTNEQIAGAVYLSPSTVKYHVSALITKLGATNRVTLAIKAHELRLDD
jgi:DNA-binding NarL/FixJ family response regulator